MEALKHLIANIPDWLRRLDDLSTQVEQRQLELIEFAEKQRAAEAKQKENGAAAIDEFGFPIISKASLRRRGSAESLRARDSPPPFSPSSPNGHMKRPATSHGQQLSSRDSILKPLPPLPTDLFPAAPTRAPPPPPVPVLSPQQPPRTLQQFQSELSSKPSPILITELPNTQIPLNYHLPSSVFNPLSDLLPPQLPPPTNPIPPPPPPTRLPPATPVTSPRENVLGLMLPSTPIAGLQSNAPVTQQAMPVSPSAPSATPSSIVRQTSQVQAATQVRARAAAMRKRQRSESVPSIEGGAVLNYRTRSMIIVYYDSYVQIFFEELVRFVSASRNMMRKAKMSAKVAQIKRMAELESQDEGDIGNKDGGGDYRMGGLMPIPLEPSVPAQVNGVKDAESPPREATVTTPPAAPPPAAPLSAMPEALQAAPLEAGSDEEEDLPPLRYVSSRRMQPMSRTPNMRLSGRGPLHGSGPSSRLTAAASSSFRGDSAPADVYDELDHALEFVQSVCERAAHQFLRDGDCGEEVVSIQKRFTETKALADREMERVLREEPEKAAAEEEVIKGRNWRPQTMRRVCSPADKPEPVTAAAAVPMVATPPASMPTLPPAPLAAPPPPPLSAPILVPGKLLVPAAVPGISVGSLEVDDSVDGGDDAAEEAALRRLVYKSSRTRVY